LDSGHSPLTPHPSAQSPKRKKKFEYYKNFKPLNADDIKDIKAEIEKLLKEKKYSDSKRRL